MHTKSVIGHLLIRYMYRVLITSKQQENLHFKLQKSLPRNVKHSSTFRAGVSAEEAFITSQVYIWYQIGFSLSRRFTSQGDTSPW